MLGKKKMNKQKKKGKNNKGCPLSLAVRTPFLSSARMVTPAIYK